MPQLLETVPQDIKSAHDYKPCAPEFFRWVVVGGYALVLLSALVYGIFVLRERQQNTLAAKDQQRMDEINTKINSIRDKGSQTRDIRGQYEEWKSWLKGNYALSGFLMQMYKALPEGARLQELTLDEDKAQAGNFAMKIRFFGQGENRVANTQDFEDKLSDMGVELQNRQESVAEGGKTEIDATISLPKTFYPGALPTMPKPPMTSPMPMQSPQPTPAAGGADVPRTGGRR